MQKYVIALYIRLSIEDYKYDSLSIENQSLVLHEYAASMPEALNAEIMEFVDAAVIIGLKTLRLKKCWKFGAFWAFSHKICE